MEPASKQKLARRIGRYEVLGRLAIGGMAEILLGRLTGPSGFERPVVIKQILPHLAEDATFVKMFLDEASITAGIRHPNVAQVSELGSEDEGLFLVMEYLEGEPVASLLRRATARNLMLDPALCAYVVAEACAGLHAAHELEDPNGQPRNIVHRDVSPQNIFVTYDGSVKVLDFGIAKAADRITKTEAGLLKGKFEYMSPEQCRGEQLDRRSDVFALGIVLYELTTRRRLFKRSGQAATIRAVLDHPITPPSELVVDFPPKIEQVVLKALSRSRRKRYQNAAELRRDLLTAVHTSSDTLPEQRLAKLMKGLFEDRIAEKQQLLQRVREGVRLEALPATVADAEVELPQVVSNLEASRITRSTAGARPRDSGRGVLIVSVGAALLTIAGVAGWFVTRPDEPAEDIESIAGEVTLTLDTTPSDAWVYLDGVQRGQTPLSLSVARESTSRRLRFELDGHESVIEQIVPDVDQRLRVALPPADAQPEAEIEETVAPEEPQPNRSRARRDRPTMTRAEMTTEMVAEMTTQMSGRGFRRFD